MNVNQILSERGKVHGDFTDNSAIAQGLKAVVHSSKNWNELESYQAEAIEMILHKLGRALSGNPHYLDHWIDIVGYSQLVCDRLEASEAQKTCEKELISVDSFSQVPKTTERTLPENNAFNAEGDFPDKHPSPGTKLCSVLHLKSSTHGIP